MQYVRSVSSSVTKTWNSINPATLSGAIDVIVVEQEDGEPVGWAGCIAVDKHLRLAGVLPFPRSLWKVLSPSTVREKGSTRRPPHGVCLTRATTG